ncbi:C-3 sterol dehydrogenase [Gautieria morchelliformis]|nr:C-3 sterol dehydrogenase [Gautieria morchelliformis]
MTHESYLVIGGCGFLGRNIVDALLARGERQVAVLDLVQSYFDVNVEYFTGDITDETAVHHAVQKANATVVVHTASPIHGLPQHVYNEVNVEGTQIIIAACQARSVKALVYTSSASLLFGGENLTDIDERLLPPEVPMDAYNGTKALAEKHVLEANGKQGLKTVALRPSGIFGPGDRQLLVNLARAVHRGQAKIQIGANDNLVDWTYVGNVAKAHLLAADRLTKSPPAPAQRDGLSSPLPTISKTTAERRIPTSLARPLGPAMTLPPNAEALEAAFSTPRNTEHRAFVRSKFDPLTPLSLAHAEREVDPLQVAGQAFLITNCEPVYFWDFMRALMLGLGAPPVDVDRPKWLLPKSLGYVVGWAAEWMAWMAGKEPSFTRYRLKYACATRYYNCEKARRVLGYEPDVGLKEGIEKTIEWWNSTQRQSFEAQEAKDIDSTRKSP